MENLSYLASTTSEATLASQTFKILGKLSSVNRNAICDIQKLNFKPHPPQPDSPVIVLHFERSGKNTDSFINEQLGSQKQASEKETVIKFIEERRSNLVGLLFY